MRKRGATMLIPNDTLIKMQSLSDEKMAVVINLVNKLSAEDDLSIFSALCNNGAKSPMTDEEVTKFVSDVRAERRAAGN